MAQEEVERAVRSLKLKKVLGIDSILMETWRYGEEAVKKGSMEIIRKIWKEGTIPENWKKSIIIPIA